MTTCKLFPAEREREREREREIDTNGTGKLSGHHSHVV
jgi:hypothetical protein